MEAPDHLGRPFPGTWSSRRMSRSPGYAFTVAVLLASFGTFWVVEGLGIPWPGGDLAILGLAAAFFAGSLVMVEVLRRHAGAMRRSRGAA